MKLRSLFIETIIKIQIFREILDIPARVLIKSKSLPFIFLNEKKIISSDKSDSENLDYSRYVEKIADNEIRLKKFRKPYKYRQILEHVNWRNGQKYIERFLELGGTREELFLIPAKDDVGKPRKYFYSRYGWLNPTQIRYLAVRQELCTIFDMEKVETIAEVGCGFGGQFLTLSKFQSLKSYTFFDLHSVQKLIRFYLSHFEYTPKTNFPDITKIESMKFDLVLSNYAFSELPRNIQLDYASKILVNSTRGYMIMNSGIHNFTNRNPGKLSLIEIREILPWIKTIEEIPLTGPDNYVIYWDRSKENE